MGMRPADVYMPNSFDEFTLARNRKIHRRRLRQGGLGSDLDMKHPQRFNHVGPNDSKKAFMMQESWKKIDHENQILLGKMTKIAAGGDQSVGGPPIVSVPKKKPKRPSGAGGNAFIRKREQAKMEAENRAMLRRITNADPNYSTNQLASAERQRLKYLSNLSRFKSSQPKFAGNLKAALAAGAMTDRAHHSLDYDGIDPARMALSQVGEEEMSILINNNRPPGSVRKVFTALMILVSPFDTSEGDVQWTAVQEWVSQLGGVAEWLHNLWNFNIGLVPVGNAMKCKKYIVDKGLEDHVVRQYSACLADFLLWVQEVCASAAPLTARETTGGGSRSGGRLSSSHTDDFTQAQPLGGGMDDGSASAAPSEEGSEGSASAAPQRVPVPPPPRGGAGSQEGAAEEAEANKAKEAAEAEAEAEAAAAKEAAAAEEAAEVEAVFQKAKAAEAAKKAEEAAEAAEAAATEGADAAEAKVDEVPPPELAAELGKASEDEAALKIQALARGRQGRKKAKKKKGGSKEAEAGADAEEAGEEEYDDEFEEEEDYEDEFEDEDDGS